MGVKYYPRLMANWKQYTYGWTKTPLLCMSDERREWIEANIQGQWTEDIFGDLRFEYYDDYMICFFNSDDVCEYEYWNKVTIRGVGDVVMVGDDATLMASFQHLYKPIHDWCNDNITTNEYTSFMVDEGYHDTHQYTGYVFCFKYDTDVVAFKLRWL